MVLVSFGNSFLDFFVHPRVPCSYQFLSVYFFYVLFSFSGVIFCSCAENFFCLCDGWINPWQTSKLAAFDVVRWLPAKYSSFFFLMFDRGFRSLFLSIVVKEGNFGLAPFMEFWNL